MIELIELISIARQLSQPEAPSSRGRRICILACNYPIILLHSVGVRAFRLFDLLNLSDIFDVFELLDRLDLLDPLESRCIVKHGNMLPVRWTN